MTVMWKAKGSKYESAARSEDDRSADATEVRSQAARQCVRQLRLHQVASPQWLTLVDSLEQLSRLAQLESLIPANEKEQTVEQAGRVSNSEGTLWDQAAHEDAIRILVEEAKVNVCLRMMIDFKEWQFCEKGSLESRMGAIARSIDVDEYTLSRKCNLFEESLGLLLLRGFMHVETLQLTDCILLVEHMAQILCYAHERKGDYKESLKGQENVAIYYFTALMKHAEQLNNMEVLAKTKEHRVIHLVLRHMLARKDDYTIDFLGVGVEGFAKMAENEDFMPQWQDFFVDKDEMKHFRTSLEPILDEILKRYPDKKSEMRPLSDFLKKLKKASP
eukprot:g8806.t1